MKYLEYRSLPFSGRFQTFLASFFSGKGIETEPHYLPLDDGDTLAPEFSTNRHLRPDAPCIIFSPGICGSHTSPYIQRIGRALNEQGLRVVIANHRGMGASYNLCRGVYHPGSSDALKKVIFYCKECFPEAPCYVIGFSMGGNLAVKALGEMTPLDQKMVEGFISVVPPLNLQDTLYRFMRPENRFYERYFAYFLFHTIVTRHYHFPELGDHGVDALMDLIDLIGGYVVPRAGFHSLSDLCHHASGKYHLPEITRPGYLVFAADDPIVSAHELDGVYIPNGIEILRYNAGGHMGFFGKYPHFFWLDHCVKTLLGVLMEKSEKKNSKVII